MDVASVHTDEAVRQSREEKLQIFPQSSEYLSPYPNFKINFLIVAE